MSDSQTGQVFGSKYSALRRINRDFVVAPRLEGHNRCYLADLCREERNNFEERFTAEMGLIVTAEMGLMVIFTLGFVTKAVFVSSVLYSDRSIMIPLSTPLPVFWIAS